MDRLFRSVSLRQLHHSLITCLSAYVFLAGAYAEGAASDLDLQKEPQAIQQYVKSTKKPGAAYLVVPAGWSLVDAKELPPTIKLLAAKSGKREIPLTLNLASEPTGSDLSGYLRKVKEINESEGGRWQQLGYITTAAGQAHLSRKQISSKWGDIVLVHAILVKEKTAYIATASALKEEFQEQSESLMAALRSLTINPSVYDLVADDVKRQKLITVCDNFEKQWKKMNQESNSLSKRDFQNKEWESFKEILAVDFQEMDDDWKQWVADHMQERLSQNFN